MDMLTGPEIAAAGLPDWRKLAQGLHARYPVESFGAGTRFVAEVAAAGDQVGHHPRVSIGRTHVDLVLVTDDAIYREDDGTEHVIQWVTQQDVDLARRVTDLAADLGLAAEPASVAEIELGLDTLDPAAVAPFWAALLTGDPTSQGFGTPGDEVRDRTRRVPNLWFADAPEPQGPVPQRLHVEVYLAPEVVQERVAAALAAGGTVVDDSDAPGLVVLADPEGNRGIVCADTSAASSD